MKILGLILSIIGSLFVLGSVLIGFAFKSEAHKYSGPTPAPEARMQRFTLLIGLIPLILTTVIYIWNILCGPDNPLPAFIYWIPLLISPPVFFAALSTLTLSEKIGAPYREEARRLNEEKRKEELTALRLRVEKGESSICELVNSDPESSKEELTLCSQQIDYLTSKEAKWKELQYFINREHSFYRIHSRTDFKVTWTDVPEVQQWFLRSYLTLFLERAASFSDLENRKRLYYLLECTGTLVMDGLNHPVTIRCFAREFLPIIKERLRSEANWDDKKFMNTKFGRSADKNLDTLLAMKLQSIEKDAANLDENRENKKA